MTDARDPRSVLDAAEQAAGAGDVASAERLLREAAALQEASLGPLHPDLANTLNNLGVVCERADKPADAERCYRRAHAIAVASLTPRHPFVATSLKNLVDFCTARGIPVWAPTPAAQGPPPTLPTPSPAPEREEAAQPERLPVSAKPEVPAAPAVGAFAITPRTLATAGLAVGALVAVLVLVPWRGPDERPAPAPDVARAAPPSTPAAELQPAPAREPAQRPVAPPRESPTVVPVPQVDREISRDAATIPGPVTVLTARVCRDLETRGTPEWQCTPVSGSSEPATFFFYTRLLSRLDTTVEHRWYRGDRLHQAITLRVRANQGSGFRTYSRNTVSPERAGDWKVELRAADGALLEEARFVVR